MDEFDFIRDFLAPLAGPEGLQLRDDAALFQPAEGFDLVITKDAMVEGVHFPHGNYGGNVAEKLLRVNLSDLAAKGARPLGYLLSLAIPQRMDQADLRGFSVGLKEMQQKYSFMLWGGDTVSTGGPLVVSATFIGQVPTGKMVTRSGAQPQDDVWVTGMIGDAYLGLQNILGHKITPRPTAQQLWTWEEAYLRPEPRLLLRQIFRQYASAALDVSDGLLADAQHLAEASHVGLSLNLENIPFSPAAQMWIDEQNSTHLAYETLLSAGDDYEVIFTALPKHREALSAQSIKKNVPMSRIGQVTAETSGLHVLHNGHPITFDKTGYRHKV